MDVAAYPIKAPYEDPDAFDMFTRLANVATLEFENIPVPLVEQIAKVIPMRPGAEVLRIMQDRFEEKKLFLNLQIPFAGTVGINDAHDALNYRASFPEIFSGCASFPAVLKTRRMGYDGRGQRIVPDVGVLHEAFLALGSVPCVLETQVDLACEISVIVARNFDGDMKFYPVVQNTHKNSILSETRWPATSIDERIEKEAIDIALLIADELDVVGLLAVEMFVTKDGQVLANELAPRPHNSGHGTIDACVTSQFEQHVRAVCNLPLGDPTPHSAWVMSNLLGDEANKWEHLLRDPKAKLHLYGKRERRPGRKMGHVTVLSSIPK